MKILYFLTALKATNGVRIGVNSTVMSLFLQLVQDVLRRRDFVTSLRVTQYSVTVLVARP